MLNPYEKSKAQLFKQPKRWLITGVAGFIGSNLLEALLLMNQEVIGLDNLSTGYQRNLNEVKSLVSNEQWKLFQFIKGDIRDLEKCHEVCVGVDYVLHEAALGSVPRSIMDPIATNENNITGFLNMLIAAKDAQVKRFIYAASSSTYGDSLDLPKVEERIGKPLSPYAVTKYTNELYADVFSRNYGMQSVGLRYFNVFGKRQNPNGVYAAVIPKWINSLIQGEQICIYGDGETSRDFSYIENIIQLNILAATSSKIKTASHEIFNAAVGDSTTLNQLFITLESALKHYTTDDDSIKPTYKNFRKGDVRHSLAEIKKSRSILGYEPTHNINKGIEECIEWYVNFILNRN